MALLKTIIRKKELNIAVLQQQLGQLLQQRAEAAVALKRCKMRVTEMRDQLWNLLGAESELLVQQLQFARVQDALARTREIEAQERLREQDAAVEKLEYSVAFARKELDKLGELLGERIKLEKSTAQLHEWALLDEWVIAQRGARA